LIPIADSPTFGGRGLDNNKPLSLEHAAFDVDELAGDFLRGECRAVLTPKASGEACREEWVIIRLATEDSRVLPAYAECESVLRKRTSAPFRKRSDGGADFFTSAIFKTSISCATFKNDLNMESLSMEYVGLQIR
jgi:hypothetical protein